MAVNERGADEMRPEDAQIAALYRHAAVEEPPAHLDHRVTTESRRPANRPRRIRAPLRWPPWPVPFATAVVALVAASLVAVVIERKGATLEPDPAAPDHAKLDTKGEVAVERAAPIENLPANDRASPRTKILRERKGPLESAIEAPSSVPRSAREAASATTSSREDREAPRETVESGKGSSDAITRGDGAGSAQPGAIAAPSPSAPVTEARPATMGSPDSARAQAPAAKAVPARKAAVPMKRESEQTANPAAALIAELEGQAPARWVDRILALRREGRRAEADGLLAELQRRHPNDPLPASLRQDND